MGQSQDVQLIKNSLNSNQQLRQDRNRPRLKLMAPAWNFPQSGSQPFLQTFFKQPANQTRPFMPAAVFRCIRKAATSTCLGPWLLNATKKPRIAHVALDIAKSERRLEISGLLMRMKIVTDGRFEMEIFGICSKLHQWEMDIRRQEAAMLCFSSSSSHSIQQTIRYTATSNSTINQKSSIT
jgi:hypothetical protein